MKALPNTKNNALNKFLEPKPQNYPIKEFLVKYSRLLKSSNERERERILNYRGKIFDRMIAEVRKYYQRAIKVDYRCAGMPEIKRGIKGWIEAKIWRLLVNLGEPHHGRYPEQEDYWAEVN